MKRTTLYKYIPITHAVEIISTDRLRMSDGSDFNDPFELVEIDSKTGFEKRVTGLHVLCLTNSNQNKLMWSHYADDHKGICLAIEVPEEYVYALCYSTRRVYDSDDIDDIFAHGKIKCKKNLIKPYKHLSRCKKISLIKDHCWMYEREYRITMDDTDTAFEEESAYFYMPVKIKRVYLGVRFEQNEKTKQDELISICKSKGVEIKKIVKSNSNYALNIIK